MTGPSQTGINDNKLFRLSSTVSPSQRYCRQSLRCFIPELNQFSLLRFNQEAWELPALVDKACTQIWFFNSPDNSRTLFPNFIQSELSIMEAIKLEIVGLQLCSVFNARSLDVCLISWGFILTLALTIVIKSTIFPNKISSQARSQVWLNCLKLCSF